MHSLTIVFGPAATPCVLLFKEEAKASVLYNTYADLAAQLVDGGSATLIGADDFGQAFVIQFYEIRGIVLEDMDLSQQGQIERSLHQARSQAKAQKLAMNDPAIRESLRMQQQGPAVYQPGMPNGRMM